MKTAVFDQKEFITLSWQEMGEICFRLSKKILAKKIKFDRIIALAKGGLTWSRTLSDYLKIDKLSVVQVKFYQDIGKTGKDQLLFNRFR